MSSWIVTEWNKVPCAFEGQVEILTSYHGEEHVGKIYTAESRTANVGSSMLFVHFPAGKKRLRWDEVKVI